MVSEGGGPRAAFVASPQGNLLLVLEPWGRGSTDLS